MRRFYLIFTMFLMVITSIAQEPILVEGDKFQASGSMNMYWESENPVDMAEADEGARWHIEKNDKHTVTFWIDLPKSGLYQLSKNTWKDAVLIVEKSAENRKMYSVHDSQFRHLVIMEYEKNKYIVQLCSILRN